jgi:hypothetical protein
MYEREHEIFVTEENIANRLNELLKKEEELTSWEALLNKSRRGQAGTSLLPSVERRMAGSDEITDDYYLNSFGKIQ